MALWKQASPRAGCSQNPPIPRDFGKWIAFDDQKGYKYLILSMIGSLEESVRVSGAFALFGAFERPENPAPIRFSRLGICKLFETNTLETYCN
jgi:hypothetical protein